MMLRLGLLATALVVILAGPARAGEIAPQVTVTLSMAQVVDLLSGLMGLDGYDKVVKEGGADKVVHQQYSLSGTTRLALGLDTAQLRAAVQSFTEAKNGLLKQYSPDGHDLRGAELSKFQQDLQTMLDATKDYKLYTISPDELKLDPPDSNPIPPSVLGELQPILRR